MEFLKINDVLQKLKISRSHLYFLIKNDNEFPHAIKLSRKNVVFDKAKIEIWMTSKSQEFERFDNFQSCYI